MSETVKTAAELNALLETCDCLVSADEMTAVYDRLAGAITERLHDRLPRVLVVMNGGLISAGKLLERMAFPMELDYLHATRYRGATEGGALHWVIRPEIERVKGRELLLIDDILDEGHTLKAIKAWCEQAGAAAVHVAVATDKRHDRKAPGIEADFVGIEVPDRYIFGEGMDYHGYFRNLNGIHALPEQAS